MDKQLIMNNLLKKSLHCIASIVLKKNKRLSDNNWTSFHLAIYPVHITTTRFCQCLTNFFERFSLELNIVVMLFLVKKTKSLKKTGGSFITNKHVNGHLFQAVTLQLSKTELLHRYNGRHISKFWGKVFTKFM